MDDYDLEEHRISQHEVNGLHVSVERRKLGEGFMVVINRGRTSDLTYFFDASGTEIEGRQAGSSVADGADELRRLEYGTAEHEAAALEAVQRHIRKDDLKKGS